MIVELDAIGITAMIHRIDRNWYEVHVDFEILKRYRLRRSANEYISRLHKRVTQFITDL